MLAGAGIPVWLWKMWCNTPLTARLQSWLLSFNVNLLSCESTLFLHSDVTVVLRPWQKQKPDWCIADRVRRDDSWNVQEKKAICCVCGLSLWPPLGNLWSQLGHVIFMLHIAAAYPVPHRALWLCNSSCQTANWISRCETDMIVSSVIQFQTNNERPLLTNLNWWLCSKFRSFSGSSCFVTMHWQLVWQEYKFLKLGDFNTFTCWNRMRIFHNPAAL